MKTFRILYTALAFALLASVVTAEAQTPDPSIKMKVISTNVLTMYVGVIATFPLADSTLVPVVHVFFRDADGFILDAIGEYTTWVSAKQRPESFEWADGVWTYTYTYLFWLKVGEQIDNVGFQAGNLEK